MYTMSVNYFIHVRNPTIVSATTLSRHLVFLDCSTYTIVKPNIYISFLLLVCL